MEPAVIYIIIGLSVVALFFSGMIYALNWAVKSGQFQNFEAGARTIFTEEEPLGTQTDYFPKKKKRTQPIPQKGQVKSDTTAKKNKF